MKAGRRTLFHELPTRKSFLCTQASNKYGQRDLTISTSISRRFFVATDEANPQNLALLREAGAVLLADLLTPEHRRQLGWTALFGDLQSEVEQAVLARAAFFGAGSRSSVPGWVLNQRKALGHAPQTGVLID